MFDSLRLVSRALFGAALLALPSFLSATTGFQNFSDISYSNASELYYDVGAYQGVEDWYGSGTAGSFSSGSAVYYNQGTGGYSWYGITYSREQNTTATDYATGQYCAITGGGANADLSVNAGGSYAVVYWSTWNDSPTPSALMQLDLSSDERIDSIVLTNVNVAYYAMLNGTSYNNYTDAFTAGDWFKLTIHAYDSDMNELGTVDVMLADYTSADADDYYILSDWTLVDLSEFDAATTYLSFSFESSDTGAYGVNTPTYVAIGGINISAIPEPSSVCAGAFVLGVLLLRRRR